MEVEGVRRLTERWKVIPGLSEKLLGYVHDRDAKARSLIKSIWGKPEFLDPSQALKGLNAKLDAWPLLCELKTKIRGWFIFLFGWKKLPMKRLRCGAILSFTIREFIWTVFHTNETANPLRCAFLMTSWLLSRRLILTSPPKSQGHESGDERMAESLHEGGRRWMKHGRSSKETLKESLASKFSSKRPRTC
jgi:hypothetical protein